MDERTYIRAQQHAISVIGTKKMDILFVCSRNKRRSLTAESIYKTSQIYCVKSAGTEPSARSRLSGRQVEWADIIFVMEKRHRERILENFPAESESKTIVVLDIPDEYEYMDKELVENIKTSVDYYLDTLREG